jgi:hypothetical protein
VAASLACLDRVLAIAFCDSRALPGKSPRVNFMVFLPAGIRFILQQSDSCVEQEWLPGRGFTTASVICLLEDADYEGHSMAMLTRIAAALNQRVEIRFVPLKAKTART